MKKIISLAILAAGLILFLFLSFSDFKTEVITAITSPHFREKNHPFSYVILHTTEGKTLQDSLALLMDPELERSYHYVISKTGDIYQLVDENKIAFHAGNSAWHNHSGLNNRSIGISLAHHSATDKDFPDVQINALLSLLKKITVKHSLKKQNIVAHADIAPAENKTPQIVFLGMYLEKMGLDVGFHRPRHLKI